MKCPPRSSARQLQKLDLIMIYLSTFPRMEERCATKDVKAHENQGNLKFFSLASPCVLVNNLNNNFVGDDYFNFNHYNCYGDTDYKDYNRNGDGDLVSGHVILWTNNILSDLDCKVK